MVEVKRTCALITTMVVLFILVPNNPLNDHHITQNPSRYHPLPRLRETYYITRCRCSWPLLLLPVLKGAS